MKHLMIVFFVASVFLLTSFQGWAKDSEGPLASIPGSEYRFDPVPEGTTVTHDYVVRNAGDATLRIENVKTGWGCTAAAYDREIPPGGEGKIEIKVNTLGYGGRTLEKQIIVMTNDPKNANITLKMSGAVDVFATMTPQVVRLTGAPEQTIVAEVMVSPSEKYDFNIIGHSLQSKGNISVTIDPVNQGQKAWKVTVTNIKKNLGRYYEIISLKTDSGIQKEIQLRVFGNITNDVENQTEGNGRPVTQN